jgi:hypothetical protein
MTKKITKVDPLNKAQLKKNKTIKAYKNINFKDLQLIAVLKKYFSPRSLSFVKKRLSGLKI